MSRAGYWFLLHVAPRIDKVVIPRTNGRLSSAGLNKVGLVTTTGAKSGYQRTQPLVLIDDGDGLLAVGSNYGCATHPAWSANLMAHPRVDHFVYDGKLIHARVMGAFEVTGDTVTAGRDYFDVPNSPS